MSKVVLGIFESQADAEAAITTLESEGYRPKDMSIVMKDHATGQKIAHDTGANVANSAATGVATGAAVGALAGLLVGVGAIAVPGFGALLVGGPLAAALGLTGAAATTVSGATTGAIAGGILGALVGLGVPEPEARLYETSIKAGAILLAVPAQLGDETNVMDTLEEYNATQVNVVTVPKEHYAVEETTTEVVDDDQDFVLNRPAYAGVKGGKTKRKTEV